MTELSALVKEQLNLNDHFKEEESDDISVQLREGLVYIRREATGSVVVTYAPTGGDPLPLGTLSTDEHPLRRADGQPLLGSNLVSPHGGRWDLSFISSGPK